MSFRLEMLQVARLAPKLLGDSADLVREFVLNQQNSDGGFNDREGRSDLYYTVFGLDSLIALQVFAPLDPVRRYLEGFGDGTRLDLVHLCALLRSWAAVSHREPPLFHPRWGGQPPAAARFAARPPGGELADEHKPLPLLVSQSIEIVRRIEQFRTADGGYSVGNDRRFGTVYGCFLALGAYQDLNTVVSSQLALAIPDQDRILTCLDGLRTPDGAWANDQNMKVGSTNATAAAVILLRHLGAPAPATAGDWLLSRAHPMGGFLAAPAAPIPDLLSTATALHALAGLQRDVSSIKDACLDFIDTLWTNAGSFHGNWSDDTLDCEYTFYALLALGHLSL